MKRTELRKIPVHMREAIRRLRSEILWLIAHEHNPRVIARLMEKRYGREYLDQIRRFCGAPEN